MDLSSNLGASRKKKKKGICSTRAVIFLHKQMLSRWWPGQLLLSCGQGVGEIVLALSAGVIALLAGPLLAKWLP